MTKTVRSGEFRTTLTLSITHQDKKALKQAALDQDTTVAELVHQWIQREFRNEDNLRDDE